MVALTHHCKYFSPSQSVDGKIMVVMSTINRNVTEVCSQQCTPSAASARLTVTLGRPVSPHTSIHSFLRAAFRLQTSLMGADGEVSYSVHTEMRRVESKGAKPQHNRCFKWNAKIKTNENNSFNLPEPKAHWHKSSDSNPTKRKQTLVIAAVALVVVVVGRVGVVIVRGKFLICVFVILGLILAIGMLIVVMMGMMLMVLRRLFHSCVSHLWIIFKQICVVTIGW